MANSTVQEIKERLDIVKIVGEYLKLKKAGANYQALCPFHSEKAPSFFVSPSRQLWKCFGCGVGGSVFDFVMQVEGIEFGDALRILAQKAGVELKREDPQVRTQRQRLYEILELAAQFFERQLEASQIGKKAQQYLLDRTINTESIKKWRLGYAPEAWQGLTDFLVSQGYKAEEAIRAGLVIKSEKKPGYYDRFRGRVMFPIFDLSSQVIGFGGRIFQPPTSNYQPPTSEAAKYINTPITPLYDKSRVLYGLNKAKLPIRKKDACILVEGYTDVIMSHQAGVENVVSISGSALASYQIGLLKRYSENLILAFDADLGGDIATERGIDLAQAVGLEIKVAPLVPETDPADLIAQNPQEWQKAIENAYSLLDFYFETAFSRFDKTTAEGKKEISRRLLPAIQKIPNRIVQSHWMQKLSHELGVKEEDIFFELKRVKSETASKKEDEFSGKIAEKKKSRKELLEERLIMLVSRHPEGIQIITKEDFAFFSPKAIESLSCFRKWGNNREEFRKVLPEDSFQWLSGLILEAELEKEDETGEEMERCLQELRSLGARKKLQALSQGIREAEEKNDQGRAGVLMREFDEWAKKLNTYCSEND